MTEKQFNYRFHGVNGPKYRGAPYHKFDPAAINESKFSDELRFKEYDCNIDDNGHLVIEWKSQSWDEDGIDGFVNEVKRCLKHIGFEGDCIIHLFDRDGENDIGIDFTI